jgi:diacylglycerol kinase (ATP)
VPSGEIRLVANPTAGGGRALRHASVAIRALHAAGLPCRLILPESAAATREATREAAADGAAALVACGGDGTVHTVLQELVGTALPLGIIAGGSGDDIAAALGFPTGDSGEQMASALVRSLNGGGVRTIDLAHVRTADGAVHYFLGVMSTGFDSNVNERANAMSRLGGHRYNVAIVRELASFRPLDYEVRIDGVVHHAAGMLVSIGNGSRYGGGMLVCPDALMDDGILDVTWLGEVSKATFLRVLPTVFKGTHVQHPSVRTYRGRRIDVAAAGQIAYADGERLGPLPASIEVRPGALRVLSA